MAAVGPKEKTPRVEGGEGLRAEDRADIELDGPGMPDFINSA